MAFDLRKGSISEQCSTFKPHTETFTLPSMVLPCHNLSVQQIFEDYCRGIIHTGNSAMYDDGDDIEEVEKFDDISDISSKPTYQRQRYEAPSETEENKPSDDRSEGGSDEVEATPLHKAP